MRSALTYGDNCWALKIEDEGRLITEMRMLRLICGKTLKDKITNEKVREITRVDEMKKFLRRQKLGWQGHAETIEEYRGPAKALRFQIDSSKTEDLKRGG